VWKTFKTWDLWDLICWLFWHFVQQTLVLQLPGLLDLYHCPCTICSLISVLPYLLLFKKMYVVMGRADRIPSLMACHTYHNWPRQGGSKVWPVPAVSDETVVELTDTCSSSELEPEEESGQQVYVVHVPSSTSPSTSPSTLGVLELSSSDRTGDYENYDSPLLLELSAIHYSHSLTPSLVLPANCELDWADN